MNGCFAFENLNILGLIQYIFSTHFTHFFPHLRLQETGLDFSFPFPGIPGTRTKPNLDPMEAYQKTACLAFSE